MRVRNCIGTSLFTVDEEEKIVNRLHQAVEIYQVTNVAVCLFLYLKPSKDLRVLKNWRPVSILNAGYKILTKSLFTCFQMAIVFYKFWKKWTSCYLNCFGTEKKAKIKKKQLKAIMQKVV